jgi:hypothetical protein
MPLITRRSVSRAMAFRRQQFDAFHSSSLNQKS